MACVQYGPTAVYTQTLVENMAMEVLPPQGIRSRQPRPACLGEIICCGKQNLQSNFRSQWRRTGLKAFPFLRRCSLVKDSTRIGQKLNFELSVYMQIGAAGRMGNRQVVHLFFHRPSSAFHGRPKTLHNIRLLWFTGIKMLLPYHVSLRKMPMEHHSFRTAILAPVKKLGIYFHPTNSFLGNSKNCVSLVEHISHFFILQVFLTVTFP